jgi:hypothetical protein
MYTINLGEVIAQRICEAQVFDETFGVKHSHQRDVSAAFGI